MKIRILLTGGTFDKKYNEIDAVLDFSDSHIHKMLELGRFSQGVEVTQLFMKDSLDITPADRSLVVQACKEAVEDRIIVTHGTDTMAETARAIMESELDSSKVVVLTGSMIPYSLGSSSDAMFNIGTALAFVQVLEPGVYVVMNGRYFKAGDVRKDKSTGLFTSI